MIVRRFRRSRRGAGGAASAYQPVPAMNAAARFAAYSANLTLLATVVSGGLRFGDLVGPGEVHPSRLWHDQALLWHSQLLDEGWDTIAQTFAVERCVNPDGERDIRLTVDDGSWALPPIDPHWVFGRPEDERGRYAFSDGQPIDNQRRRIHFQTGLNDDILQHAVAPLLDSVLSPSIRMFVSWWPDAYPSAAQALISVWLSPITGLGRTEIDEAYRRCTMIATNDFPPWDDGTHTAYAVQLLGALSAHHEVPAKTAAYVLGKLAALDERPLLEPLLRTATTVLDRVSDDPESVAAVAQLVLRTVERHGEQIRDPAVAVRHVIAVQARRRSEPAPPDTSAGSGPADLGGLRGELAAIRTRLAALRAELADGRAEVDGVSREFDQVTTGSTTLRTAALALGQARQAFDDAEAALEYTGERIGAWVADHP